MSNAKRAEREPIASCSSPGSGESENYGNAGYNPVDQERLESPIGPSWSLIDHPDIWMRPDFFIPLDDGGEGGREQLKTAVLRSERLKGLLNTPKNEITCVPNTKTISRRFYCAICNEIPFPWKGKPDIMMDEDQDQPFPETVFLCANGHSVCRACAQFCRTCTFSKSDLSYISQNGQKLVDSDKAQDQPGPLLKRSMSMFSWGQNRLCFAPIDAYNSQDHFLADVIEDSEFACQYFYNWCSFRGRGKALQYHEENCECKPSPPNPKGESGQATEDACEKPQIDQNTDSQDDEAILGFDHFNAVSKANDLIGDLLAKHFSSIDLTSVSPYVLKNHIPDWDEREAKADAERTMKQVQ